MKTKTYLLDKIEKQLTAEFEYSYMEYLYLEKSKLEEFALFLDEVEINSWNWTVIGSLIKEEVKRLGLDETYLLNVKGLTTKEEVENEFVMFWASIKNEIK